MKALKSEGKLYTLLLLLIMSLQLACASKSQNDAVATVPVPEGDQDGDLQIPNGPFVPGGSGPGNGPGDDWEYGGTGDLVVASLTTFSEYAGRPINSISNPKINLNLTRYGGTFGGTVTIGYTEQGIYREGYFTSGSTESDTRYNVFFTSGGKMTAWHGFFEDFMGGLIVVIDEIVTTGDGAGSDGIISGSVWFKNFAPALFPHPPKFCWFVSRGPYDCRAWPRNEDKFINDPVDTYRALYPDNGYKKFAEFSGIEINDAFNGEL